jgi:predicted TIM-barrel fold metal-dependent hydrolase
VDGLIEAMDKASIDRAVCLGIGNTADRVESANRFVGSLPQNRFVGIGSLHPDLSVEENVDGLRRYDLKGAKIHSYFQGYPLDDSRLWEILDAIQGEFCIVAHVGPAGSSDGSLCTPEMIASIARNFPDLALVACHLGGYQVLEDAYEWVVGKTTVAIDTSWPPTLSELPRSTVRRTILRHGPENVVFASDWPMTDPARERAYIESLRLEPEAVDAILGGNLERILGLKPASEAS